jgi:hypothetical protein
MAPLVRIAPNLRAVLAAHVTFQFVDGRRLRPAHDVQCHCLVRVAAEAADLKVEISGVQGIAEARRGLSRSFETQHALNGQLPSEPRPRAPPNAERNCRKCSREIWCPSRQNAPAWRRSASRYRLGSEPRSPLPVVDVDKSAAESRESGPREGTCGDSGVVAGYFAGGAPSTGASAP